MTFEPSPMDYLGAYVLAFAWGVLTALAFVILWVFSPSKPSVN